MLRFVSDLSVAGAKISSLPWGMCLNSLLKESFPVGMTVPEHPQFTGAVWKLSINFGQHLLSAGTFFWFCFFGSGPSLIIYPTLTQHSHCFSRSLLALLQWYPEGCWCLSQGWFGTSSDYQFNPVINPLEFGGRLYVITPFLQRNREPENPWGAQMHSKLLPQLHECSQQGDRQISPPKNKG